VNLLPAVTPPISGMVMEIKKAANLQEQRKGFFGNAFQYDNMAINDEGQPRVSEVSHCNVKGKEKRVNKGTETSKRKDGNGLEAQNDEVTFYKYIYIYIYKEHLSFGLVMPGILSDDSNSDKYHLTSYISSIIKNQNFLNKPLS